MRSMFVNRRACPGIVLLLGVALSVSCKDAGQPAYPRVVPAPTLGEPIPHAIREPAVSGPSGAASEPLRVGGDVTTPFELVRVEPDCRQLEDAERPIRVELIVSETGHVNGARLVSGASPDAREAILKAVRGWLFRPATMNGRPVAVYFDVTFRPC
jgi:hypothetical protein